MIQTVRLMRLFVWHLVRLPWEELHWPYSFCGFPVFAAADSL